MGSQTLNLSPETMEQGQIGERDIPCPYSMEHLAHRFAASTGKSVNDMQNYIVKSLTEIPDPVAHTPHPNQVSDRDLKPFRNHGIGASR